MNDLAYTTTTITGNGNTLLEPGELIRITVDFGAAGTQSARTRSSRWK